MQKSILASAILISLTACGSDDSARVTDTVAAPTSVEVEAVEATTTTTTAPADTVVANEPVVTNDGGNVETDTTVVVNNDGNNNADDTVIVVNNADSTNTDSGEGTTNNNTSADAEQTTSNDAGSNSTSDGGQSNNNDAGSNTSHAEQTTNNDADGSTSDVVQTISDDAGSSTSDGGQTISDDAGSSTSDGGQTISNDAGSSTSDGGQTISDDAGSSTSDGGAVEVADNPAPAAPVDAGNTGTQGNRDTNAGTFASGVDGNVIRVSSLSAGSTQEICTTRSNPDDFSDTQVGDFILHNNAWRTFRAAPGFAWEQCIFTNTNGAVVGWNYDWGPGVVGINGSPNASGDFFVRSYPELIYGTKDEFRTSAPTSETGLPVRISEMPNFRIDYSYDGPQFGESRTVDASNNSRFPNGTTISGERNVAVESFFYEPNAAGNCTSDIVRRGGGSNHTYEVMVWLDAGAERLPAGPNDFVADLTIRGEDYKVYTKDSDERYIAFVAQNPQTTGTIFMNDYIDWARDNAHVVRERFGANSNSVQIQDDWCMANILVGTEIFWGAGSMNIFDWTITQSR